MPLIACPDCESKVSSEAPTCPNCGRPIKQASSSAPAVAGARLCPHCGAQAVGKVRGLQGGGEVLVAIILILAFLIPGVIYYIYMESVPYCSGCGRRVWK
jgi:DNA-directed RNA polymerase subunit RPC12/RpoP